MVNTFVLLYNKTHY